VFAPYSFEAAAAASLVQAGRARTATRFLFVGMHPRSVNGAGRDADAEAEACGGEGCVLAVQVLSSENGISAAASLADAARAVATATRAAAVSVARAGVAAGPTARAAAEAAAAATALAPAVKVLFAAAPAADAPAARSAAGAAAVRTVEAALQLWRRQRAAAAASARAEGGGAASGVQLIAWPADAVRALARVLDARAQAWPAAVRHCLPPQGFQLSFLRRNLTLPPEMEPAA
jgi:hypothetical protein